jgi:hypothetical protein
VYTFRDKELKAELYLFSQERIVSDYYKLFSSSLPLKNQTERTWCEKTLKELTQKDEAFFEWELQKGGLAIYSEDSGEIEHVGNFVRAFLKKFHPKASWSMDWSETCSRPELDGFSGGTMFVCAENVRFMDTSGWLEDMRQTYNTKWL